MVHTGWELLSEVGYFHSFSLEEDPLLMREICERHGVKVASLSAHSPLMKPEAAVPRLTRAMILASFVGTTIINSDEMLKPAWLDDDFAHEVMRYTLTKAEIGGPPARDDRLHRAPRRVHEDRRRAASDRPARPVSTHRRQLGHGQLVPGRHRRPVSSPPRVTFTRLVPAGIEDPYEGLEAVADLVHHVHAKDISLDRAERDRGTVTGTPVGCACGDGVVDWERVLHILAPLDRELFLSVECGTSDEAERSLTFLQGLITA